MSSPIVKERPILFSGEMVRAILGGRKTQTRRILSEKKLFKPVNFDPYGNCSPELRPCNHSWPGKRIGMMCADCYKELLSKCPYGKPGDRLWVRETWMPGDLTKPFYYRATDPRMGSFYKWKPSIHMPRRASRITLEITNVSVERLNYISEEDALWEGVDESEAYQKAEHYEAGGSPIQGGSPSRFAFISLWESINGAGSWGKNPWVWVIGFKMVKQ